MNASISDRCAEPLVIDGIRCFAPELMTSNEDYPAEAFARLVELEARNFWFRSRNRIITGIFTRFLTKPSRPKVLEIGCGTGFVLSALNGMNRFDLVGSEQYLAGLVFAKQRVPRVEFVQLDARSLPYDAEFDAIGAFDVLEHIEEDEEVIRSARNALRADGQLIVTVPQHPWLWSSTDDLARHKRRYTRKQLVDKLGRNGFRVRFCTSFVFALLPLMYLSRLTQKSTDENTADYAELDLPRFVNEPMEALMRIDELLIAMGCSLPFGGSLLAVAQREP